VFPVLGRIQELIQTGLKEIQVNIRMKTKQHAVHALHRLGEGNSVARIEGFDYAVIGDVHEIFGRIEGDPIGVFPSERGLDLPTPHQEISPSTLDNSDVLYAMDKVLVISSITADYHLLESGKIDAIIAHQGPNLRNIVFQADALPAEPFIEERALTIALVAPRHQDDLVLEHLSPTIEDGPDLELSLLLPGKTKVLRLYDRVGLTGIQLESALSRIKEDNLPIAQFLDSTIQC
jgi:hypothetical protein